MKKKRCLFNLRYLIQPTDALTRNIWDCLVLFENRSVRALERKRCKIKDYNRDYLYARMFCLKYFLGLSYEEIGKRTDYSKASVRKFISYFIRYINYDSKKDNYLKHIPQDLRCRTIDICNKAASYYYPVHYDNL